jgi:hypothetical protein
MIARRSARQIIPTLSFEFGASGIQIEPVAIWAFSAVPEVHAIEERDCPIIPQGMASEHKMATFRPGLKWHPNCMHLLP